MKAGDKIEVRTNYGLLNNILGLNYNGWQKGYFILSKDSYIWMISLNGKEKQGWINKINNDGTITEDYLYEKDDSSTFSLGITHTKRFIFDKIICGNQTLHFVFLGVYELVEKSNKDKHRILKKISDETDMF